MINKFKRKIDEIRLALAIGLSQADKTIMSGTFTKAPESAGIINPNYSRNSFLRNTQLGQLKQEEVERFNEILHAMDYVHGKLNYEFVEADVEVVDENGNVRIEKQKVAIATAMTPEEIAKAEETKQKIGDYEEGYKTLGFIRNDTYIYKSITFEDIKGGFDNAINYIIENDTSLTDSEILQLKKEGKVTRPRLIVYKDEFSFSNGMKIENFTKEVLVKKLTDTDDTDTSVLIEFYCTNYNIRQQEYENKMGYISEEDEEYKPDLVYNKVMEGLNLKPFTDISNITLVKNSATSNYKLENYKITNFKCIKKLDKGFVVKFDANLF